MSGIHRLITALITAFALVGSVGAVGLGPSDRVENFTLESYDGKTHSLDQYRDSVATVVMFIATQCPISNAYNQRIVSLVREYQPRGFQFLGINSNRQESVVEIKGHALGAGFTFPILKDEGNVIADRFGASFTPEIYVVSPDGVILYHGRIDDSRNPDRIESHDLANALDAILTGRPIDPAETRAFGCTIKRVEN
ncbi:MAG TPA: thioredoxin family protein [Firmicutes bacterium]|nr:thioredoxin family protein [Bacillota bacterium]